MGRLMIGISGVRGVVGDTLSPELLVRLGQAFGAYCDGGRVVVGRDTRVSGDMVKHAVFSGLLSTGCQIVDVGVCATPTAAIMVREKKADGGVVISASHNPIEWNALKFFRADGTYLNADEGRQLLDIYYGSDTNLVSYDRLHAVQSDLSGNKHHLKKVLSLLDVKGLRKRKFHVAMDGCNGAGASLALAFLKKIGARAEAVHCEMTGEFARNPEPTATNIKDLQKIVKAKGCDVGFAQDADADRIAFVSEQGKYIGEEYSLCLASRYILSHTPGPIVTNLSTTRMIEDVANTFGCEVVRTPVGEVNVADEMRRIHAPVGGEGNGGVIDPRFNYSRDGLTGMALMLQLMLETGQTVSELARSLPRYHMMKEKIECGKRAIKPILEALANEKADRVDSRDGVKLDFADGWVHIRASNTEPIVRVYAEAKSKATANALTEKYLKLVRRIAGREKK